jgi:hypothetical protein
MEFRLLASQLHRNLLAVDLTEPVWKGRLPSCVSTVCWHPPLDPLLDGFLAESRMLDVAAGVAGTEAESPRVCFDRRRG